MSVVSFKAQELRWWQDLELSENITRWRMRWRRYRARFRPVVCWLTVFQKYSNNNNDSNNHKTETWLVAFASFYGVNTPSWRHDPFQAASGLMSAHKVPEYLAISFPEQVGVISTGSVPKYTCTQLCSKQCIKKLGIGRMPSLRWMKHKKYNSNSFLSAMGKRTISPLWVMGKLYEAGTN